MMIPETAAGAKFDESIGRLTDMASKLTASIQSGDKECARALLEDLLNAQPKLDINITVPVSDNLQRKQENEFSVRVHVEDREAAGGVFSIKVKSCDTILDLKRRFLLQYNLPIEVQRWIIGKRIRDDRSSLHSLGVKGEGVTLYLYIVTAHSVGLTRENFEANRQAYAEGRFAMPMNPQLSSSSAEGRFAMPMNPQLSSSSDGSLLVTSFTGKPSSANLNSSFLHGQPSPNNNEKTNAFMMSPYTNQDPNSWNAVLPDPSKHADVPAGPVPLITSSLPAQQSADSGIGHTSEESISLPTAKAPQSPAAPVEPTLQETIGWNCPVCTFCNLPTRPGCAMCSTSRPESYEIPTDYQMTPEEELRLAVDEEMERKTREPGSMGLSYAQKHENLMMQLVQEGIDPQQLGLLDLDEEGFQVLPQSVLHEQSQNKIFHNGKSPVARGPAQMRESPVALLNAENMWSSSEEEGEDATWKQENS